MTVGSHEIDTLRADLARIHAELESAERLDPETRMLLEQVMSDIRDVLARPGIELPEEPVGPLREALERMAVNLESSNPALADGINRLSQTLSNMGI